MTKTRPTAEKADLYQEVTDKIIAALESGVRPWAKSWKNDPNAVDRLGILPLRFNGAPYTGINVVLLWIAGESSGYRSTTWMTFKQAIALGGAVRKGEKGTKIIYASTFKKKVEDAKTGEQKEARIPFLKGYTVFNVDQIDGLPEVYHPTEAPPPTAETLVERIGHAEEFFANIGAEIRHGGNRAFYSPAGDFIQLPQAEQFDSVESYYATEGHEAIHWTGAEKRLKRDFSGRFGSDAYAAEELVAELGAAFLCARLGLTLEPREDHAAYLASWLKVLKGDKKFIVSAASQASKAVEFLYGLQAAEAAPVADDTDEEAVNDNAAEAVLESEVA